MTCMGLSRIESVVLKLDLQKWFSGSVYYGQQKPTRELPEYMVFHEKI